MTNLMHPPDPTRILADNRAMHDQPGYPEFYDRNLGLMTHPWEREVFLEPLKSLCRTRAEKLGSETLRVLDLGAGTGNLTLELLAMGYRVTAVDLSNAMLGYLRYKAQREGLGEDRLESICGPVDEALRTMIQQCRQFHVVCACSFYHHLPDYLATLELAAMTADREGSIFLAHEPMRKDTIDRASRRMQWLDFKLWRAKVRIGKLLGRAGDVDTFYDPNSLADYWDIAGGCDQDEMAKLLRGMGFHVELVCYDSKRSRRLHHLCRRIGTKSLFMIAASR